MGTEAPRPPLHGPIAITALKAQQLFQCCLETDEASKRLAESQLTRFELWTSNIGVYTRTHASLDYRLRTAVEARSAIEGNLEILCEQLLLTLTGNEKPDVKDVQNFMEADPYSIAQRGSALHRSAYPDLRLHKPGLLEVERTITTLHQLSLTIRKASNRNTLAKVPRLLDMDEEYILFNTGSWMRDVKKYEKISAVRFDITTSFEEFVRQALGSRWMRLFPRKDTPAKDKDIIEQMDGLSEPQREYRKIVFERCISSITARRRQLTYFRSHQSKLSLLPAMNFASLGPSRFLPSNQRGTVIDSSNDPGLQAGALHSGPTELTQRTDLLGIASPLSETVPSEFLSTSWRLSNINVAPSTAISSTDDASLLLNEIFELPPAPELEDSEKEKECPYCCLVYPRLIFEPAKTRRWRKHLMEDLQPYVCLFRNCERPGKSYQSFKEWQAHLDQTHYQDWQLPQDPKAKKIESHVFEDLANFREHLTTLHPNLDRSTARSITHASGQPTTLPSWCFVCLESHEGPALLKHILGHLQQAFLLALPPRDDVKEIDAVSSGRSSVLTRPNEAEVMSIGSLGKDSQEDESRIDDEARLEDSRMQNVQAYLDRENVPPMTAAERYEDVKRRIIESVFAKSDDNGQLLESYILHVHVMEDAEYPQQPHPPSSATAAKRRVILVSVRNSGRVRVHKARENVNGTFSIGKTWNLEDLNVIQSWQYYAPRTAEESQLKEWAGDKGFTVTFTRPYYWEANTAKEKMFFIASLVKVYRRYMGGKVCELTGFQASDLDMMLADPVPKSSEPEHS